MRKAKKVVLREVEAGITARMYDPASAMSEMRKSSLFGFVNRMCLVA